MCSTAVYIPDFDIGILVSRALVQYCVATRPVAFIALLGLVDGEQKTNHLVHVEHAQVAATPSDTPNHGDGRSRP
jgi:hypothetical protein